MGQAVARSIAYCWCSMPRRPEPTDYYGYAMTEAELREKVVELAHEAGWLVFSLPIARTRRPVKDAIGYPDLTLAKDNRVLWIELKTENGTLTRAQMRWKAEIGDHCLVIRPSDLVVIPSVLS